MRVRAAAGKHTFRRGKSLRAALEPAQTHVRAVKAQALGEASARERAARERAARERVERVERALGALPQIEAQQARSKDRARQRPARASTTDAQARVARMGDGGFRPAYNVQMATERHGVVVGVGVTNGNDAGQLKPMLADIKRRLGRGPQEHLVDGGFVVLDDIEAAATEAVTVYAPLPEVGGARAAPQPADGPGVRAWRERMAQPQAQGIYKERAATAELSNADVRRWRGLDRVGVRGMRKVYCVLLWAALAHNVVRGLTLGMAP